MTTLIQFLSIILILFFAIPGTQILWSKVNPVADYVKRWALFIGEVKSQILNLLLPKLKKIAALFF